LIGLPLYNQDNEKIKPVFKESIWEHLTIKL
jgi:hypothetical protein